MIKQIVVAYTTEGTTDVRFLESIIQRTFEDVAFECTGQVEIYPVQYIPKQSGHFIEVATNYARYAEENGTMVLCIHCDSDDSSVTNIFNTKIDPAFRAILAEQNIPLCKNLVALIPVQMTEAWMLADKDLLKEEIGTVKNNTELGLDKTPESYNNPKQVIENAVRIARQDLSRRRRCDLTIGALYTIIGQKILLSELRSLSSYARFREEVQNSFIRLNYLQP